MAKRAVLFDLDDTLSRGQKSYDAALEAVHLLWEKKHPGMNLEEFKTAFNATRSETFQRLGGRTAAGNRFFYFERMLEVQNLPKDYAWILNLTQHYWQVYLEALKPRQGAVSVLRKLKQLGIKVGIITNLDAKIQSQKLVAMKLAQYVDAMVSAEESGVAKPDSKIFEMAFERLGFPIADTLLVGDDIEADIIGGNRMGVETALIKNEWHKYTAEEIAQATYQLKELKEVLKLVI